MLIWPVLKSYDSEHLARIAMPLGGIGTGDVSLGGRGDLRDWEIMNKPGKGFKPTFGRNESPFFAIRTKSEGTIETRVLEGSLEDFEIEGDMGCKESNHGLPRFRECSFDAAYPFGQVHLSDKSMPVEVTLEAFNPLIPSDVDRSSLPVAIMRYRVRNLTNATVETSICGTMHNFIGCDGSKEEPTFCGQSRTVGGKDNRNKVKCSEAIQGIAMDSLGVDPEDPAWGTMALTTTASSGVSMRTAWAPVSWGNSLLDFWEDFTEDGQIEPRKDNENDPMPVASLCVNMSIPANSVGTVTFILAWHFPNRQSWKIENCNDQDYCDCTEYVGNYYTEKYKEAWAAAEYTALNLDSLEADSLEFANAFCKSDLPESIKVAALFNLAILRTQTCFRTPDGRFYAFEGTCDCEGCCMGSCTHVWNYENALAFLFGELSQTMREIEFIHATDDTGCMSFRVHLPLSKATEYGKAAADGQMGCLMKLYRDWQLSGDDKFLKELWPHARRALEFCWLPGSWDADCDGVMEGCQHNTMDVEYFGPNPQMGTWYLGALRAAEEMAKYLGEDAFASKCAELFKRGSEWMDDNLFNGEYYEHIVKTPESIDDILPSLYADNKRIDLKDPDSQLGAGCLVDQMVGQYMAHICGLGYLLKPENIKKTLGSIYKYNRKG